MNYTAEKILRFIEGAFVGALTPNKYDEYRAVLFPILKEKLNGLAPTKPDDDSVGFIAYNSSKGTRIKMKTGRFISTKLKLKDCALNETQLRIITNNININLFGYRPVITFCKGKQITRNYANLVGGRSCMCGSNASCTKLYEMNPDRFQQLVMRLKDDSARAIVTKLDNGKYLFDRVYSTCSRLKQEMLAYAEKRKWYIRGNSNFDYNELVVSGLKFKEGNVPYQDTLKCYLIKDNKLTIFHPSCRLSSDGYLEETDGCILNGELCEYCGNRIRGEHFWYRDCVYCNHCWDAYFCYCYQCNESYPLDDCYETEHGMVCSYCHDECYTDCDKCSNCFHNDNLKSIQDEDIDVCPACFKDYSYHSCYECSEYYLEITKVKVKGRTLTVCEGCYLEFYSDYDTKKYGIYVKEDNKDK